MYKQSSNSNGTNVRPEVLIPGSERRTIADETIANFQFLSGRAKELAELVNRKLIPVTRQSNPPSGNTQAQAKTDILPPLFDELMACSSSINMALDSIEDTISRTEL